MIKVLTIFGTRPEVIKMAPVIHHLSRQPDRFCHVTCSTGQHREMLHQALCHFDIRVDYDLNLMTPSQTLSSLTARLFDAIDRIVDESRPDWVLVQGDTTTAMVASLVAFYRSIRLGHIEAGLRTGNKRQPFPEEINRRIVDMVTDVYFAPTCRSRDALLREGVRNDAIHVVGNTVVDALLEIAQRSYDWDSGPLAVLPKNRRIVLVTAHRRESFGGPFRELCLAIQELAAKYTNDSVHFVYPVHLNPNVQSSVFEILSGHENVSLLPPLDYLTMVHLMKRATLVLTDSGGIQEEAPSFSVPVLVMRNTTERPEGVEAGVIKLVGTDRRKIVYEASRLLEDTVAYRAMACRSNPYGDGHAAERIVAVLGRDA